MKARQNICILSQWEQIHSAYLLDFEITTNLDAGDHLIDVLDVEGGVGGRALVQLLQLLQLPRQLLLALL